MIDEANGKRVTVRHRDRTASDQRHRSTAPPSALPRCHPARLTDDHSRVAASRSSSVSMASDNSARASISPQDSTRCRPNRSPAHRSRAHHGVAKKPAFVVFVDYRGFYKTDWARQRCPRHDVIAVIDRAGPDHPGPHHRGVHPRPTVSGR